MEGARWDDEKGVIAESYPKVLYDIFPIIYMDPIERSKDKSPPSHYVCPVYKTSERRGVVGTTGHSTNFVMPVILKVSDQYTAKFWTRRGAAMLTQLDQ
jgi:Dynein heavy chain.